MENDIKQHTLVFDKGMSSVPSDLLCPDDTLEVCEGMTLDNGEWKAIQKPKEIQVDLSLGTLMYVHVINNNYKHYIFFDERVDGLCAYDDGDGSVIGIDEDLLDVKDVTSIGNTIIVNSKVGLTYYLWDATSNSYKPLGDMPNPDVEFMLNNSVTVESEGNYEGIITFKDHPNGIIIADQQNNFNDLVVGLHSKCKNELHDENAFYAPFFARAAFELSDGTYYKIGQPVLMLPSWDTTSLYYNIGSSHIRNYLWGLRLYAKVKDVDLSDWSDIIRGYTIFVSKEIDLFDTTVDQSWEQVNAENTPYACLSIRQENGSFAEIDGYTYTKNGSAHLPWSSFYKCLKRVPNADIVNRLKKESLFYKIADIERGETDTWINLADRYDNKVLRNLTTQTRIDTEDYYSFTKVIPRGINTFNRRLNIYGVSRSFFSGFSNFINYSINKETEKTERDWAIVTYIKSSNLAERVVVNKFKSSELFGNYYYYPDTRATKAEFYFNDDSTWHLFKSVIMEEHRGLNGSIYLENLPTGEESIFGSVVESLPVPKTSSEYLNNYLLQSDVDNPFVVNASGYVRVGQGEIIGLAGLTTALSQDAYKVATTIAFTTQGIWALKIDEEGRYAQVTPPFSREVCVNDKSITMVDNAVFFVSEKGLMCITDTTEQGVVCVSEQLHGNMAFMEFLRDCEIAYDYTDSMLLLYKKDKSNGWVYNMKSGVWSTFANLNGAFKTAVADYPDYLVQNNRNKVYSLMEEPYREEEASEKDPIFYEGLMKTRAMKFEGSLLLKSIRQLKHLKNGNGMNDITFEIYAKNDLREEWHNVTSLKGKAWKFYQFRYTFENITATDSFAGTVVVTQVKHTDKLR